MAKLQETEKDMNETSYPSDGLEFNFSTVFFLVLVHTSLFSQSTTFLACTTVSTLGSTQSITDRSTRNISCG